MRATATDVAHSMICLSDSETIQRDLLHSDWSQPRRAGSLHSALTAAQFKLEMRGKAQRDSPVLGLLAPPSEYD